MESTDGIKREANRCVISAGRSFSGMASRLTSMSGNEQKTIFAIRALNSQKPRGWRPSAELAGSIAHELNQPLMSILANAQAAKKWLHATPPNVAEVNSSIERTIRDARAADERMQHIRALFKQESFEKKDINIPQILREVVRIVQEDPKKRDVSIECHFENSLPVVSIDQIQVQQVFNNLIVNAIEALEGQKLAPLVVLPGVDRLKLDVNPSDR